MADANEPASTQRLDLDIRRTIDDWCRLLNNALRVTAQTLESPAFQALLVEVHGEVTDPERIRWPDRMVAAVAATSVSLNWPPSPRLPWAHLVELAQAEEVLDTPELGKLWNARMSALYEGSALDELHASWCDRPWLAPLLPALGQCIESHGRGWYWVSIPTLLALQEGVYRLAFSPTTDINKGWAKQMSKLTFSSREPVHFHKELHRIFVSRFLNGFKGGVVEPGLPLNRNAVLHGADHHYGTEENSARCLAMLESLIDAMGALVDHENGVAHRPGCDAIANIGRRVTVTSLNTDGTLPTDLTWCPVCMPQ